jgi:hypothetical protein
MKHCMENNHPIRDIKNSYIIFVISTKTLLNLNLLYKITVYL